MKKILILNGGYSEVPIIKLAKKRGYYVLVTGNNKNAPGNILADKYICADYSDYYEILKIAEEEKIDGIVSCSNDFGAITASYVAEKMKLKGHDSFENALNLHQKDRFKKIAKQIKLLSIESHYFENEMDAREYVKKAKYPIIIKPVDLTGGKGISRVNNEEEANKNIEKAFNISKNKRVIIEPFIDSYQHVIFCFIEKEKVIASCALDDHYLHNPYLAAYNSCPSKTEDKDKKIIINEIERLSTHLHLSDGYFEIQYMTSKNSGDIYIVETMRRLPGNIALSAIDKVSNVSWSDWYLSSQIGESCEEYIKERISVGNSSMISIMTEKNGIIKNIYISDELKSHIFEEVNVLKIGDKITDYLTDRISYLLCNFENKQELYSVIDNIKDHVKVSVN